MACPARARQAWRPAAKCKAAGNCRRRDADAWKGPMAGLVGNIALGGSKRRCDRRASLFRLAEPDGGAASRADACDAEIRGSNPRRGPALSGRANPSSGDPTRDSPPPMAIGPNPLSSTTKSARAGAISYATEPDIPAALGGIRRSAESFRRSPRLIRGARGQKSLAANFRFQGCCLLRCAFAFALVARGWWIRL